MKTLKKALKATVPMRSAGLMKALVLSIFFVGLFSLNSYAGSILQVTGQVVSISETSIKVETLGHDFNKTVESFPITQLTRFIDENNNAVGLEFLKPGMMVKIQVIDEVIVTHVQIVKKAGAKK